MSDQLTDPGFWDNYWQNVSGWQNIDLRHSYDRAFDAAFRRWLTPDPQQKLLEIGCAPGRWLIYFHRQFGYQVSGCDSAPQAVDVTRANLQQAQVPGEVLLADLMDASLPVAAYDIVMSLGVIEHFADPWPAIEQHVRLIKPGGTLLLEMPNYTGLNAWWLKRGGLHLLDVHNTSIMRLSFLQDVAARFNLTPRFTGLIGGYEPGLWDSTGRSGVVRNVIRAANLLRRVRLFDRINHPAFSGYWLGVYRTQERP
ncbi:MAG: class I SAM-dependent methyltransferase [Thermoflexales bacterium]|jgi:SAM-dependent methyltransferase|nr:class I SAM-dependent methyltransferase [Thermoflexales bacterium]